MSETRGQRLKRIREQAGLTQEELSRKAKVPLGTLRNLEQDHRPYPRVDTAILIAHAVGKPVDEVFIVAK